MNNRAWLYVQAIRGPILLVTIGVLFAIHQAGILPFSHTWPLLIIVIGVMKLLERLVLPAPIPGAPVAAAPVRPYRWRARGSVTGPLILIAIGVLFLMHALQPSFPLGDWLIEYWPFLLIFWGVIEFIEISVRALAGTSIPINGVSGGAWVLIVFICIVGLTSYEVRRPGAWWRTAGWERGVEAFGEGHDYSIATLQRSTGQAPHIVIESFRGDAKITGTNGTAVIVNGHKTVRAFRGDEADRANSQTPVEVEQQGNTITIRCNQDKASSRTPVTTDLDISVPKGSTIEATGQVGDFDISSITGSVNIGSDNAGVRLQDIGGDVTVDTRRSDLIRCVNVNGGVELRGHGSDVELTKIGGQVTIGGDYTGTITLHDLAKPVHVENMRTDLDAQQLPGEIRLDRGSLSVQNVVGPLRLTTRATDVTLAGFSNGVELSVDKGDIDLNPGTAPLSKMVVHTRSGNIELALPQSANFALSASTDHGDIDNEFGDPLKQSTEGRGARLEGSIGTGPNLNLTTDRGSITVRKTSGEATAKASVL